MVQSVAFLLLQHPLGGSVDSEFFQWVGDLSARSHGHHVIQSTHQGVFIHRLHEIRVHFISINGSENITGLETGLVEQRIREGLQCYHFYAMYM